MPKAQVAKTSKSDERKTTTNWRIFESLGVSIKEFTCWSYPRPRVHDSSCKTRMHVYDVKAKRAKPENIIRHIDGDHGGGFKCELSLDGPASPLWRALEDSGVECAEFRCGVCHKVLILNALNIKNHFRVHLSGNRRNVKGGQFWLTLSTDHLPEQTDEEILEQQSDRFE